MVQQDDAGSASRKSECNSLWLHLTDTAPWSNGNDTWSTPRKRWFDSIRGYLVAQVRQLAERLGLNPGGCRFDSGPGHGPVGNLADHLGLEPHDAVGSSPTWAITNTLSSWSSLECSPACHAGDRGFKSRRGRYWRMAARYANRQSGQAQTLVICGFESRLRHSRTTCDDWALASPTGRNPAIP